MKKTTKICITFLFMIIVLSIISYTCFGVLNPIKSGLWFIKVSIGITEYCEIRNDPRIIISSPDNAWGNFLNFLSVEGYSYSEDKRLGSIIVIEKDDVQYHLFFSLNSYYSLWKLEKQSSY